MEETGGIHNEKSNKLIQNSKETRRNKMGKL